MEHYKVPRISSDESVTNEDKESVGLSERLITECAQTIYLVIVTETYK